MRILKKKVLVFIAICVLAIIMPSNYSVSSADNSVANKSGMEYIVLKPSLSFEEQVTKPNTIYEVKNSYDLKNKRIKIPTNCSIKLKVVV